MIGIDITKISRFKNPKTTFINKVLHPNEIKEYNVTNEKEKFLAARWAIKEALFKVDNSLFHYNRVEIFKRDRIFCYPGYIITTTSEDDYYFSVVIKEK